MACYTSWYIRFKYMITPDEYIHDLPDEQRSEFERVQTEVLKQAPDAVLVMSYGIPSFKYKGKILLHFGAFKDHVSIFPASDDMITEIGAELEAFRTSKGTLQFTGTNPLPDELLGKVITFRLKGIE